MATKKILKKSFSTVFRQYGKVIVPKGTSTTNLTALGMDPDYNFVDEFDWIDKDYPAYANILKMDMKSYGLHIPEEYLIEIDV